MKVKAKKLLLAIVVFSSAHSIFAQPVLVKTEQQIYEYKLDNGLHIVLAPNSQENKIYINTIYHTGSLNDPQGKGGLAHLLEHLAFKGTENIKGDEFQRQLDQYTLSNNASTDYYSTRYINILRADKQALAQVLALEAERMDKLVLQEKFVPKEIDIVRREREIRLDQPLAVMMDQIWKEAYGNQSLGRLPIGDLDELKSINMAELYQYYRTYYAPNNAVIVITGKFDTKEALQLVEHAFANKTAKTLPTPAKVPLLDSKQLKNRQFVVKKGSELAKFNIYFDGANKKIQTVLSLAPYLYTLEPSGHLYQSMVKTGVSTNVFASTWLDQNFNLIFLGAQFSPSQDSQLVQQKLVSGVENTTVFNASELERVKNIAKNSQKTLLADAIELGSTLSSYLAINQSWSDIFAEQREIQALDVAQVNQILKQFLTAEHRVQADILPTPEDLKKAQAQQSPAEDRQAHAADEEPELLKDAKSYKREVIEYQKHSAQLLQQIESKIERGNFGGQLYYALYPSKTRDDIVYATINMDFGNEKSLLNQSEIIDLTSYLLLRGSQNYSLQQLTDKSIAANGNVTIDSQANHFFIKISADKEHFAEYFAFVMELLKHPDFSQAEFDLARAQFLQGLDRPYTEPDSVSGLILNRILERYTAADLRYHFEPEIVKSNLQKATNAQVKAFYKKYFAMDKARISVTGEFDSQAVKSMIQSELLTWSKPSDYQPITTNYVKYTAQKVHALAEQREFGSYQSILTLPVGLYHPDTAALIVLDSILGESQLSSRLAKELREKNALVYSFNSELSLSDESNTGSFGIEANYNVGRAQQVSQAIHKVFNELIAKGVTEQELEAAKAKILKQRAIILEDNRNIQRLLDTQLKHKMDMKSREERDQQIARLTVKDINRVIHKYIKLDQFVEVMADQYGHKQP